MALINGALQIGRSAIMTSQAALSVVGNNMANAATPSYSRQRVTLMPTQYSEVSAGRYTGTGVAIPETGRVVDGACLLLTVLPAAVPLALMCFRRKDKVGVLCFARAFSGSRNHDVRCWKSSDGGLFVRLVRGLDGWRVQRGRCVGHPV